MALTTVQAPPTTTPAIVQVATHSSTVRRPRLNSQPITRNTPIAGQFTDANAEGITNTPAPTIAAITTDTPIHDPPCPLGAIGA
jgi:hypothetical protein